MTKKIYFAHPINMFDTELEKDLERMIRINFFQQVENPNKKHHQEGYHKYKLEQGNGMLYYTTEVLPKMVGVVSVPFPEGTYGAGVAMEHNFITANGGRGYIYNPNYGKIIPLARVPEIQTLSVEATRDRVYNYDYLGNLK